MTEDKMRELVKECGLDWEKGYFPLFEGDTTNRFAVLIEVVEIAERERCKLAPELPVPLCPWCGTRHDYCDSPGALLVRATGCQKYDSAGVLGFQDERMLAEENRRLRDALEKYRGQVNQYGEHTAVDDLELPNAI